ncbi:IMS domain-containing protein [Lyngbya aestuarii]|uniref:IMS domain-containing protein n=1 Tax=Lyngbya aestuarii TaxID=118322 RepID=UPI00403DC341
MRIPLDYYRILGLPIQATAQQISQAYRDRALQLPRREYSEAAINSRKQLFDEAYTVLSEPEKRQNYDASFLARTYEQHSEQKAASHAPELSEATDAIADPHTPSIDIKDEQFIGSLLILQELGEYELVLKLGRPLLTGSNSTSLEKGSLGDPHLVRADIVLTVALACLELGREQWQQGQYEKAASSLEAGQESLLQEGLFPAVRGEIQSDIYKLRPYRILELLALPEENIAQRRNGLRLLQEMLQERGGIDGTGNDQSGLSIDDFLRFIQQLRSYLSAAQQQTLFEAEARRPSAVATYLAVYALLARGFAQRQPALIARAKQMLLRLGRRQDVHLEQAVCALLLGQTEEASRALELSQEYEPLAFIREHSQGSPDLLPGLCLYGERWLQASVFPHFRDLSDQKASLKEYFADEQVQAYLEKLPESSEESNNEWDVLSSKKTAYSSAPHSRATNGTSNISSQWSKASRKEKSTASNGQSATDKQKVGWPRWEAKPKSAATEGSSQLDSAHDPFSGISTLPIGQQTSHSNQAGESAVAGTPSDTSLRSRSHNQEHQLTKDSVLEGVSLGSSQQAIPGINSPSSSSTSRLSRPDSPSKASSDAGEPPLSLPPGRVKRRPEKAKQAKKARKLFLLAIVGLAGLAILWLLLIWLQRTLKSFSAPGLEPEQPLVQLAQPPIEIPQPGSRITAPDGPLTEDTARQVIQTWLDTKKLAFGSEHQIDALGQILANPALSVWQQRAQADRQNSSYRQYEHTLTVTSVETNNTNSDLATVEAAVSENAKVYQDGRLDQSTSYNENLGVRYELIRQQGQWFIRDMAVVR